MLLERKCSNIYCTFWVFFCIVHWSCFISSRALAEWKLSSVCLLLEGSVSGKTAWETSRGLNGSTNEKCGSAWWQFGSIFWFYTSKFTVRIIESSEPNITEPSTWKKPIGFPTTETQQKTTKTQKLHLLNAQHEKVGNPQPFGHHFFCKEPPFASSRFVSPLFRNLPATLADFGNQRPTSGKRRPARTTWASASTMVVEDAPRWWLMKTIGFPLCMLGWGRLTG